MKIVHCCLGNFYIDNHTYQENLLPLQNKLDGQDVYIIASTETFAEDNTLMYVDPSEYINEYGILVRRIPYRRLPSKFLQRKIRAYVAFYDILCEIKPDIIFFHSPCSYDLLTAARYRKYHKNVKLFVDSHEDKNNSAMNFLSKNILHKFIYKNFIRFSLSQIEKIFYISEETKDFLIEIDNVPDEKLEFFPMGGVLFEGSKKMDIRNRVRSSMKLTDDNILFIHSGKLGQLKRTEELLRAFYQVKNCSFRLIIIGSIPYEMESVLLPLISADSRVSFLGWKNGNELLEYLCAGDMYLQPGSQSAVMENSICCGSPVMLYPYTSYTPYYQGNVCYIETVEDMVKCFNDISKNPEKLKIMSEISYKIAHEMLDYRKIVQRMYQ